MEVVHQQPVRIFRRDANRDPARGVDVKVDPGLGGAARSRAGLRMGRPQRRSGDERQNGQGVSMGHGWMVIPVHSSVNRKSGRRLPPSRQGEARCGGKRLTRIPEEDKLCRELPELLTTSKIQNATAPERAHPECNEEPFLPYRWLQ